ncbi:hypothetical protein WNX13_10060, partial [Lactobacillus delbrueckii]|uniref:hypothetical protein n=1 Tax=Lactobacillus delbrueckii TaxID=1584 RepID=UPI0030E7602F
KKIIGFPGSSKTPGSFGLYDNGYWQMERASHDVAWPAGSSDSAKFWTDGQHGIELSAFRPFEHRLWILTSASPLSLCFVSGDIIGILH